MGAITASKERETSTGLRRSNTLANIISERSSQDAAQGNKCLIAVVHTNTISFAAAFSHESFQITHGGKRQRSARDIFPIYQAKTELLPFYFIFFKKEKKIKKHSSLHLFKYNLTAIDNHLKVQFRHYSPTSDISGTAAIKGPSGNLGALSLMSCTLMMNSDSGSRASFV